MVDLKEKEFYEKNMIKTIAQGNIDDCKDFIAAQQEYIRLLVAENEKLREKILDNIFR